MSFIYFGIWVMKTELYHSVFTKSKKPHNLETQGNISNSLKRGVIFVTSNPNTHKVKDFIYNMLDPLYLIDILTRFCVFIFVGSNIVTVGKFYDFGKYQIESIICQ